MAFFIHLRFEWDDRDKVVKLDKLQYEKNDQLKVIKWQLGR
jgi:hypothetical protein